MSILRFFCSALLCIQVAVTLPMPLCCCIAFSDPFPNMDYDEIPEERIVEANAQDVIALFFGGNGIIGVVFFLPATILLIVGNREKMESQAFFRISGFVLFLLWSIFALLLSKLAWEIFLHEDAIRYRLEWDSEFLAGSIRILCINIIVALCCAAVLVRKPKLQRD